MSMKTPIMLKFFQSHRSSCCVVSRSSRILRIHGRISTHTKNTAGSRETSYCAFHMEKAETGRDLHLLQGQKYMESLG